MKRQEFKESKFYSPGIIILFSFLAVIAIGAVLLSMPFSSASGGFTNPLTALFTAVTSTCVTGLVTVDTGTYWSTIGHVIILALIQIGGIGLVTLVTFFTTVFRHKIGLSSIRLASESVSGSGIHTVRHLLRLVISVTFSVEAVGALLLAVRFIPQFGTGKGIWYAVFTAVSAYCNAGIDLMGKEFEPTCSFVHYSGDVLVNLVIMTLIVIGGLGFIVFSDALHYRKSKKLMLHTRVVLITSLALILFGAVFYFLFEFSNPETIGKMSIGDKILASFFQSVSTRTAGFNTISQGGLSSPSKVLTLFLMFVGASPGGTGGGIKTTTFIVLFMTVLSTVRGKKETTILHRKVLQPTVYKALTIVSLASVIAIITGAIIYVESCPSLINSMYESFSAIGTVGLSTGITSTLGTASKIALMITMLIGRVGPFSFFFAIAVRQIEHSSTTVLPEGQVIVG